MADLVSVFEQTSARHPGRTALVVPDQRITFGDLAARARGFAAKCARRGLGKGDRVLVAMPVGIELYVVLAGLWRLGAVVVFPEPAMGLGGLRHAIGIARPRGFVASGAYRALKLLPDLWPVPMLVPGGQGEIGRAELASDDPALISFTSGSTGQPKAIERSHGFLMAQHDAVLPLLETDCCQIDLVGFPVFVLVNLAVGRPSALPNWKLTRQERVDGRALARWIAESHATRALLPPSLCEALTGADLPPALHTIFTGGGPVKPGLVAALLQKAPGLRIVSVYGSTEAEPIAELDWADVTKADRHAMAAGLGLLAGAPVPDIDLRIDDDEILVAGPHVNRGYLDPCMDRDTKIPDGERVWHRTGDAGRLDAQGRLWLLGRKSAVITTGIGRLYPFAVELTAESWPGIDRAALILRRGQACLVTQGHSPDEAREKLQEMGIQDIVSVRKIPMDRRHRSKIDYPALRRLVDPT